MKNEKEYKSKILCPEFVNRKISVNDGNLLVHQKIFWPCWRYAVTITCNMKERLNPFERVVLELSNYVTCDSERIAHMTGINIDMVKFTQQLLQTKFFIDKKYNVTEEGKKVIKEDEENIKDNFFIVYQEAYTGELLPVIEEANTENWNSGEIWEHKTVEIQLDESSDSKNKDNIRHFYASQSRATVGDEILNRQLVYAVSYPQFSMERNMKTITPEHIVRLIKQLSRKGRITMSKVSAIRVGQSCDAVLVLTDYGIDNNNTRRDFLTTGFDKERSLLMETALSRLSSYDQKYIAKIRKDAETSSDDFTTKEESANIKKLKERWWFNNQIKNRLVDVCGILENYDLNKINNKSDNKYFDYCSRQLIIALYESLQFAFYQAAKDSIRYAATISSLADLEKNSVGNKSFNNLIKIGFDFGERENEIKKKLKINPQKLIDSMENEESIALWSVLTFCSLECSSDDLREVHVLKDLGMQFPQSFKTLLFINDKRNSYQHKTKDAEPLTEHSAKKTFDDACKIIEILLPAKKIDKESGTLVNKDETSKRRTSSAYMEKLFKAQNNLEVFFGREVTSIIPEDIYNELENAEMYFADEKDIDAQLYFSLATIMQSLFFNLFLKEPYEHKDLKIQDCQNMRKQALDDAVRVGFSSANGKFPMLQKTNPNYILKSYVNRMDNTLGADCILWLCLANESEKKTVAKAVPDLLKTADRLVELRGHNASDSMNCSIEELFSLRKKVYSFAKFIIENGQLSV